jgi:hypothetical protein
MSDQQVQFSLNCFIAGQPLLRAKLIETVD